MFTLKQIIPLIALLTSAIVVTAQDYNNIEFIENKGQWDNKIRYKGDVNAGAVFIRSTGFTILQHNQQDYNAIQSSFHEHTSKGGGTAKGDDKYIVRSHSWNIDFVGASPGMQVLADKPAEGYNNYFYGNDPSKWAGECKLYQAITLKDVYPNVDVRYYTYNGMLKYDIIAKPGADISKIALKYEGADKLSVKNKELVVSTSLGEMKESYPYTYQTNGKQKTDVSCKYVVKGNIVSFDVKGYDPSATLVIDPTLIFCSFSGSRANNWGFTATYGPDGSFFGGGIVFEGNSFPVSPGAFQTSYQGGGSDDPKVDMGIIKLSANGANRIYATYLGGSGNDQPHSLISDEQGNLIIAGRSSSPNYPGTLTGPGGGYDVVVTKLNATGSALIGSRRIGGTGNDGVNIKAGRGGASSLEQNYGDDGRSEVNIDGTGNIYVASSSQSSGNTSATKFPTTPGSFQPNFGGGVQDGVILKFSSDLSTLLFASYLGGSENDAAYVLSLGPSGDIYVGGGTQSSNFPGNHAGTVGSAFAGDIDGYVAQISNDGSTLIRSTFLGTEGKDQVYGLKFDRLGFPYVVGQTTGNWPITPASVYNNAGAKQFIAKLQPNLSAYVYSTVFGRAASLPNISPIAFLVDRCENVYVSGWGGAIDATSNSYPNSGTFGMPITADALSYPVGGPDGKDFYFFVLQRDAASQLFGSYFGQNGGLVDHVDGGTSRFDQNGIIYQAICANCNGGASFPTTPGVWAPTRPASAYCNLGMVKISFNLAGVGSDVSSSIGGVPRDTAGCLPLTVDFSDLVHNAKEYIWNFGDGSPEIGPLPAATGYTQSHTFNNVGIYRVMLIGIDPASCNVRDTSYMNIRVGDLRANLQASFVKLDPCTAFNYRFSNLSTTDITRPFTDTSFTWNFGDGSPRVRSGLANIDHTYPAPGTYNAWLILNDTAYCNNPDSIRIEVRVAANVDASFETPPVGCAPYTAVFNNTSVGGLSFEWNFGDPASGPNNTSTLSYPTHVYSSPGTYNVVMVANDPNTCNRTDTARFTVVVYDKPAANFSYTPTVPAENTENVFTNLSSLNAVSFKWIFDDGDSLVTTSRADVRHQYNLTGTFNVSLIAFNAAGCSDTLSMLVTTIVTPALDVPNAFTPNSGNVNSIIYVRGYGITKMHFTIWNRWGQKVFETENRSQGWDGKVKGVVQPMDVYAYTLDVEFFDGKKTTKKGDITLIR